MVKYRDPKGLEKEGRILKTDVLDKGYVRLVNHLGSDIDVANSARVSFNKEVSVLDEKDEKLINYLVKHKHDSTLRHCVMTFEVYAPLMIARQWYKHTIASTYIDDQNGWNESSRRYITEDEEFYIPRVSDWRSVPDNKKQGSGEPVKDDIGARYTMAMIRLTEQQERLYKEALSDGIAPEQARLLLPAYSMYVRWRWTASLNALLHFISLRLDPHAQHEIQLYAKAINDIVVQHYPITAKAWNEYRI